MFLQEMARDPIEKGQALKHLKFDFLFNRKQKVSCFRKKKSSDSQILFFQETSNTLTEIYVIARGYVLLCYILLVFYFLGV